jgi:superfamily II DNA/RNA helicase
VKLSVLVSAQDSYATNKTFAELGVLPELVAVLTAQGITTAFPIQALTISDALAGRDVCGKAKTGSGKTLGFGLPMLQRVAAGETFKAKDGNRPVRAAWCCCRPANSPSRSMRS